MSDYNEEAEGEESAGGLLWGRIFLAIGLVLLIIGGAFGGTYYYGYVAGLEEGRKSLPPVVLAENNPTKIPACVADDKSKVAPELNIYDVAQGDKLNNPTGPAANAGGEVENLLAAPASKPVPKKDEKVALAKPAPTSKPVPKATIKSAYMVQLLAAQSRSVARTAYKRLQSKHKELTAREPLIIEANLGDRGLFYRVNVEGFANKSQATKFCAGLKKQGQDCFIRKQ